MTSLDLADRRQLEDRGIPLEEAERQLALFRRPPPPARLLRPATPGDGIETLADDAERLQRLFAEAAGRLTKFVPASGAASRMFKSLSVALEAGDAEAEAIERLDRELQDFAFAAEVEPRPRDPLALAETVLTSSGLGLRERPKGLIPFHRDAQGRARTAFEEHLAEGAELVAGESDRCRLHFTVSPEHRDAFEAVLGGARGELEARYGVRFEVDFSEQSPATDTLAATPDNEPFRLDDGTLLLRPGGHGALIGNLQRLGEADGDLVLIKNIDNVQPFEQRREALHWLQALLGRLVELEAEIHRRTRELIEGRPGALDRAVGLLTGALGRPSAASLRGQEGEAAVRTALGLLDRPLRVCGMVRNEGEPGGGPFWVADPELDHSLQIVETSQIDLDDPEQRQILERATHFNPVLLACALRRHDGSVHDLERFVDPQASFVAEKSLEGRPLRALERPGLWNGAMAGWTTVFVELPIVTFSPVKTLFDLLRPEHRSASDGRSPESAG